jgi:hypothetical protein
MSSTLASDGDMPMSEAIEAARKAGEEHGRAGASWVFDGNTPDEARQAAARGLDAGDPLAYDQLGGNEPRFGDGFSTRDLCDEIGVDYALSSTAEVDQIADAYLDAARDAYWDAVDRAAHLQLA